MRDYKTSSLKGRGKSNESSRYHKTVNIGFDFKTYCKMKVVSANTGKSMKTLLVECFLQIYGQPTDDDVAIIRGEQPAPAYQTVKPIEKVEPVVIYDSFTGLPVVSEESITKVEKPIADKLPLIAENKVAKRLFKRQT